MQTTNPPKTGIATNVGHPANATAAMSAAVLVLADLARAYSGIA